MITTKQLSFGYKKGHPVFSGLDLSLPQGSIVGLLGRNGEGKTTLLKNLYGQLFSKQGEIDVLGFTPRERKVSFLQQVYLLPEEIQVPRITIRRYFDLYAPFYPNYDEAIACELIETFSLPLPSRSVYLYFYSTSPPMGWIFLRRGNFAVP